MPRIFALELTPEIITPYDINIVRDEKARIIFPGGVNDLQLKISKDVGGEPLVDIPSENGLFNLFPALLDDLIEGQPYRHDIWDYTDPDDPIKIASGLFRCLPSIASRGVRYPTVIGPDGRKKVFATQAQIDAIVPKDPDTEYVATDAGQTTPLVIATIQPVSETVSQGGTFTRQITATGGAAPYAYAAPAGYTVDQQTGVLTGSLDSARDEVVSVTVTDSGTPPQEATASFDVLIEPAVDTLEQGDTPGSLFFAGKSTPETLTLTPGTEPGQLFAGAA